jgi:UDP-N-acetyl-D-mannosaminuronate dehydrogenase
MVELAEEINTAAPLYVATRIWSALNDYGKPVKAAKILVLGVTYKPNIADCRESPADPLVKRLLSWGADVNYHDPFVPTWSPRGTGVEFKAAGDPYAEAAAADIVVLLQAHSGYDTSQLLAATSLILDTRSVLPQAPHVIRL